MAARGVHFALTNKQEKKLLRRAKWRGDDAVLDYICEDIEESWEQDWLCETDKAWDAIHRCLTDGKLDDSPSSLQHLVVLGGRSLYRGEDYLVRYNSVKEVAAIAGMLAGIKHGGMREKYFQIDPHDYGMELSEDDWGYTWGYFEALGEFFQRAATGKRAVIFTADQ